MKSNPLTYASTAMDRAYLPLCILFCVALAYDHFQLISYEIPLDSNEAGMVSITATLAAGENPFAIASQPARASVYPVLYNAIVAPLTLVLENTLRLHRFVAGVFIVAACCLLFFVTNKASRSPRNSFAAATLFYAGLLYYSTPIASPNGIGILLFLATLFVPWWCNFSNRSLLAALVLGILSFYGKQYFVASLGYVALYLFIGESKFKGILFGASSLAFFLASLAIAHQLAPYFLDNTVFSVKYVTQFIASNDALFNQLLVYGKIILPILLVLSMKVSLDYREKRLTNGDARAARQSGPILNLKEIHAPFFTRKPNFIWMCMLCSLVIIVMEIGKNPGNRETYLFQMVSPFLLAGTFIAISGSLKWRGLYQVLAILALYNSYVALPHDYSVQRSQWQKLQQTISGSQNIYAPAMLLEEIIRSGGEVYQNAHTPYIRFAAWKPAFLRKQDEEQTIGWIWENYVEDINAKIVSQAFDLILLDKRTKLPISQFGNATSAGGIPLLEKHYRIRETLPVTLAKRPGGGHFRVQVWEPIPQTLKGEREETD